MQDTQKEKSFGRTDVKNNNLAVSFPVQDLYKTLKFSI